MTSAARGQPGQGDWGAQLPTEYFICSFEEGIFPLSFCVLLHPGLEILGASELGLFTSQNQVHP